MPLIGLSAAVGGFILLAVIIWAVPYTRRRYAASRALTEASTRGLFMHGSKSGPTPIPR